MAERRRRELETGKGDLPAGASSPLLADAVKSYLEDCEDRNLEPSTLVSYRNTLGRMVAYFPKDTTVGAITYVALRDYRSKGRRFFHRGKETKKGFVGEVPARTLSALSSRKELTTIRSFFNFAENSEWLTKKPTKKLKAPKDDSRPTLNFSDQEVDAILEATGKLGNRNSQEAARARKRALAIVSVFLRTGLRISDVTKLRRDSVDLATGQVRLMTMKTGTPVYVTMPSEAVAALAASPVESSEYFFWSGKSRLSTAIGSVRRTLECVFRLAGVEGGHPHRFRDTFAVEFLTYGGADGQGGEMRDLQLLLGHSSLRTTEKSYAPFDRKMQRRIDGAVSTMYRRHLVNQHPPVDPQDHSLRDGNKNVLPFPAKLRA